MLRLPALSPLLPAAAFVLAFTAIPEATAQSRDGVRGHRATGYYSRHRIHGLRYSADYYSRPRQSRLSFSRERALGQRGHLDHYPGPPDSPHRGRLFNDYAAYPSQSHSRWYRLDDNRSVPSEDLPAGGADTQGGEPTRGRPWRGGPPSTIIIDPEPSRDRTRELPMAGGSRDDGWTLLARGETVRALGSFAGRVAVKGSDAEARVGYALAAAIYGDDDTARTAMRLALEIDPAVLERVTIDAALASRLGELQERYAKTPEQTTEPPTKTAADDASILTASLATLLEEEEQESGPPAQLAAILRNTVCRMPPLR